MPVNSSTKIPTMVGRVVVVRSGQSGVHVGRLLAKNSDGVLLADATRLWYWKVAKMTGQVSSCSEIAVYGIKKSECRLAVEVALHEIGGVCEVIPLTKAAIETFK